MFILKDRIVNVHAPIEIDGVRYPNLLDESLREQLGVQEVAEPTPPADYSEETYDRQEVAGAPYVVFVKKSDEQIAAIAQAKTNQKALAYLAETDWMVTRFAETGEPVPAEVKAKRQAARDSIVRPAPEQA